MTQEYEKRLVELVDELYEEGKFLIDSSSKSDIAIGMKIAHLKGYIDALMQKP